MVGYHSTGICPMSNCSGTKVASRGTRRRGLDANVIVPQSTGPIVLIIRRNLHMPDVELFGYKRCILGYKDKGLRCEGHCPAEYRSYHAYQRYKSHYSTNLQFARFDKNYLTVKSYWDCEATL